MPIVEIHLEKNTWFDMYFCICFCHSCSCSQQLKIFESRNQLQEKKWTHEIPVRKNFGPTNTHEKKSSDPRNTHDKKFRTHEKILDPRNTHEKKNSDPRNTREKKFWTHEYPRWHDGTKPTRSTAARHPRNLARPDFSNA